MTATETPGVSAVMPGTRQASAVGRPRPTNNDIAEILNALEGGRTVQWAADTYGWPRQRVVALINGRRGWLHDPGTDCARIFKVTERFPDPEPETTMPTPATTAGDTPTEQDPEPAAEPVGIVGLEALLHRAEASDSAATRNAGKKVRVAVEELRQRVNAETAEARVRAEIAELENQLAAKQEKLRELRPVKKTTKPRPSAPAGLSFREIRDWAKARGLACPSTGRIPNAVIEQYKTAHGLPTAAETAKAGA